MDQRERTDDLEEALRVSLDGLQARLWTALPGIIESYNITENTVKVQPAISCTKNMPDGSTQPFKMPLLVDCPVVFPGGGGYWLTFPIAPNDEVLIVIATRCINAWWAQGDVQPEEEFRMHDLSDGFVVPGVMSKPNVIVDINSTRPELRNADGTVKLEATATGFKITGTLDVTGRVVAGFGGIDQVNLQTHIHVVAATPGNSAPPTAGT